MRTTFLKEKQTSFEPILVASSQISISNFGNMAEKVISVIPILGASTSNIISKLYNDKSTSDVTFIVGPNETRFFGHTLIIGAASDVFKANFSGNWKDSRTVKLEDVKEDVFKAFMLYIYKSEINMNTKNILDVLELAHRYMMTGLVESLTTRVVIQSYVSDCFWKLMSFVYATNDVALINRCLDVLDKEPETFLSQPEFLETKSFIIALFVDRNSLDILEVELFRFLLKWSESECKRTTLEVTPENQRKVMESFIHKIRFPIMTLDEFAEVEETGVLSSIEVDLMRNGISSKSSVMTGCDWKPRGPVANLASAKKCDGPEPTTTLYCTYEDFLGCHFSYYLCLPCALICQTGRIFKDGVVKRLEQDRSCQCKTQRTCKLS